MTPMAAARGGRTDLAGLLKRHPRLLRVLERHGVHVCAGCLLTLTSPVDRAAAYHGVPDIPGFLSALGLRPAPPRKHGRRASAVRRRGRR
ncbi:MAG: hypothetical protein HY554_13935 [Elusimicrobia bacterium]|nr:hypothetical protein [Elusimicrobiota bacterium]